MQARPLWNCGLNVVRLNNEGCCSFLQDTGARNENLGIILYN